MAAVAANAIIDSDEDMAAAAADALNDSEDSEGAFGGRLLAALLGRQFAQDNILLPSDVHSEAETADGILDQNNGYESDVAAAAALLK